MPEQSLQLRLQQKMQLAPQLQMAIRLLQLSRLELREHIQEVIDENPLLEREESPDSEAPERDDHDADEGAEHDDWDDPQFADEFESSDWGSTDSGFSEFMPEPQIADTSADSLREHLLWQVNLAPMSETDTAIAMAVIYALDEDGFLSDSMDDIRASLAPELLVGEDEVVAVLHRVQRMEPVGVASRDPGECIRVQLSVLTQDTPGRDLARRIARDHLELVAEHDNAALARETGSDANAVAEAVALIQSLEARPGLRFDNRSDEYLVPDLYVQERDGEWLVSLSPDNQPRLRLNDYYVKLLRESGGEDRKYLNSRLQEARWLINSIDLRNRTLVRVGQCIVEHQAGFLEHGEIAMKPLVLREIADQIEMHESTVSRATTRKYMLTPRGLFELKYFFSSHVSTTDGGTMSATAVKARLALLIENEPRGQPLSDQELSRLLRDAGIKVARRTVAKYREALGIGSSAERRRAYRRLTRIGKSDA